MSGLALPFISIPSRPGRAASHGSRVRVIDPRSTTCKLTCATLSPYRERTLPDSGERASPLIASPGKAALPGLARHPEYQGLAGEPEGGSVNLGAVPAWHPRRGRAPVGCPSRSAIAGVSDRSG